MSGSEEINFFSQNYACALYGVNTRQAWEYVPVNEDCGEVVDQSKSSAAFACNNAADLEGNANVTGKNVFE